MFFIFQPFQSFISSINISNQIVSFTEDYPNNLLFSEDPTERQILKQLANRLALVINGATGEKYLVKTLDYNF